MGSYPSLGLTSESLLGGHWLSANAEPPLHENTVVEDDEGDVREGVASCVEEVEGVINLSEILGTS